MKSEEFEGEKKMSALDWGILGLIVLVLTVFAVWYLQRGGGTAQEREIRYTVRLSGVDVRSADTETGLLPIGRGDTVRSENGTLELGYVEAVTARPSRSAVASNGEIAFCTVPGRMDVDVTVRGIALYRKEEGLRISDTRIAAGTVGGFRFGGYYVKNATVITVEEVTE